MSTQKAKELLLNKHFYIFLWYSMVSCVLCLRERANDRVTITGYRCFKIVSRLTILERAVLISWEFSPSQEITRLMKSTELCIRKAKSSRHGVACYLNAGLFLHFKLLHSTISIRFSSDTNWKCLNMHKCINQNGQVHAPSHRVPIL